MEAHLKTSYENMHKFTRVLRMLDEEFNHKREQGLCYKCNGKYFLGHLCKDKRDAQKRICVLEGSFEEEEKVKK
jgi:peptide methionine sulfoxide reductase MsrB